MSRIHNKSGKVLLYAPCKETVTGLVIPSEPIEIEIGAMEFKFTHKGDITYTSLAGLKDASGEFTGYFDK